MALVAGMAPAQTPPAGATPAARNPTTEIPGERLLPRDVAAIAWLRATPASREAFEASAIARLWEARPGDAEHPLRELARRITDATGLDQRIQRACLAGGITLAALPREGGYGWLAAIVCGDETETLRNALGRMRETAVATGGSIRNEIVDGVELWQVRVDAQRAYAYAVHEGVVVVGDDPRTVESAVRRGRKQDTPSLVDATALRALQTWTAGDAPLLTILGRDPDALRFVVATTIADPVTRSLVERTLRSQRIGGLGLAIGLERDRLVVRHHVAAPAPRPGALGRLVDAQVTTAPSATEVPPEAIAFTVGMAPVGELLRETLGALTALPTDAKQTRTAWHELATKAASGPLADAFSGLADRFVVVEWAPSESGAQNLAVFVDTASEAVLRTSVDALLEPLGQKVSKQSIGAHTVHHLLGVAEWLPSGATLSIARRRLVVATSETAMRAALAQLDQPRTHAAAAEVVADLAAGVRIASWSEMAQPSPFAAAAAGLLGPECGRTLAATVGRVLAQADGARRSRVLADADGVVVETTASVGDPRMVALLAGLAADALAAIGIESGRKTGPAQLEWHEITAAIAKAQRAFRDATHADDDDDRIGEFGDLAALVGAGLLDPSLLGHDLGNDVFERDGHLVTMLLPESVDGREQHFVFVAWPARGGTGRVHASTPDKDALFNDLIAGSAGIRTMSTREIHPSGSFGTAMGPGWREHRSLVRRQARPEGEIGMTVEDIAVYELILAAEKEGKSRVGRPVVEALKARNPIVAARAAHALGLLKASEAVPQLVETVQTHEEIEVRRHAMGALAAIGDPRTVRVSVEALGSDDVVVRALAAKNLAALKTRQAVDPLLGLLAAGRENEDRQDCVQALIALADIGEPAVLTTAASAATGGDKTLHEALAYLLSSLSPKLPRDQEPKALMGLLDHPVQLARRYAIQRLGELGAAEAVVALESRLGREDATLRPLIEVSLAALRRDRQDDGAENAFDKVLAEGKRIWGVFATRFAELPDDRKLIAAGLGAVPLVSMLVLLVLRRRRRRRNAAESWAKLVAPSDDYVAESDVADVDVDDVQPEPIARTPVGGSGRPRR